MKNNISLTLTVNEVVKDDPSIQTECKTQELLEAVLDRMRQQFHTEQASQRNREENQRKRGTVKDTANAYISVPARAHVHNNARGVEIIRLTVEELSTRFEFPRGRDVEQLAEVKQEEGALLGAGNGPDPEPQIDHKNQPRQRLLRPSNVVGRRPGQDSRVGPETGGWLSGIFDDVERRPLKKVRCELVDTRGSQRAGRTRLQVPVGTVSVADFFPDGKS
jgi:hypothetical protein